MCIKAEGDFKRSLSAWLVVVLSPLQPRGFALTRAVRGLLRVCVQLSEVTLFQGRNSHRVALW